MQTPAIQSPANSLAELLPVLHLLILSTIHLHCKTKIQPRWRAEKLFKMLWISSLWQEGENPPSVIVDQHDGQIKPM